MNIVFQRRVISLNIFTWTLLIQRYIDLRVRRREMLLFSNNAWIKHLFSSQLFYQIWLILSNHFDETYDKARFRGI